MSSAFSMWAKAVSFHHDAMAPLPNVLPTRWEVSGSGAPNPAVVPPVDGVPDSFQVTLAYINTYMPF